MKKRILAVSILFASFAANADDLAPLPTQGLSIVSLAKVNIPEKQKKELTRRRAEEKKNGFYETKDDTYTNFLLNVKRNAPAEIRSFKAKKDPYDTHMKASISDIKLAFQFKGLNGVKKENIIGYAAIGGYTRRNPEGWTGIKTFFSDPSIGTCGYAFYDLKAANGGAQLNTETTEYLVNKKPSSRSIQGNYNSGFSYYLNWFGDTTMSELECANKIFDKEIMTKMIELASKLDKQ